MHKVFYVKFKEEKGMIEYKRSSCGQADSVIDLHTTGPGFKTRLVRYFLPSFLLTTISRSGLTQDIKMGNCVFQCDVPHQWIAQ